MKVNVTKENLKEILASNEFYLYTKLKLIEKIYPRIYTNIYQNPNKNFFNAIIQQHNYIAEFLFNENIVDINAQDSFNQTALHKAINSYNKEMVLFLLKKNINIPKDIIFFACCYIAHIKDEEVTNFLIEILNILKEYKADINVCAGFLEETPLHIAVDCGNYKVVEFLLKNGADFSITNKYGKTAFDYAKNLLETEQRYLEKELEKKHSDNIKKIYKLLKSYVERRKEK